MRRSIFTLLLLSLVISAPGLFAEEPTAGEAVQLLSRSFNKIQNYRCTIDSLEVLGRKKDERLLEYHFMKPDYIYIKILKGNDKGSRVWYHENRILACMGGILGAIKVRFKPTDKMVLSLRGNRIDHSSWDFTINDMKAKIEAGWESSLESVYENGTDLWKVTLSAPTGKRDNWYEYRIDPVEHIMIHDRYFENCELATDSVFSNIEINKKIDPNTFR